MPPVDSSRRVCTLDTALVNRPVIFLQILAASAVDAGASSLMTVFKPSTVHPLRSHANSVTMSCYFAIWEATVTAANVHSVATEL